MADATYNNQAVYMKQGGNEEVIASGGVLTVESGGEVTIESGGTIDVESGGGIDIESGGDITLENGGAFNPGNTATFFSGSFYGAEMKYVILSQMTVKDHISTVSVGVGPSIWSQAYGYHTFSFAAGCSKVSYRFPSAEVGMMLFLNFSAVESNANVSLLASTDVTIIRRYSGLSYSNLLMHCSLVQSGAWVKLICYSTNLWTIVEESATGAALTWAAAG